ncbi:transketolase [Streptococcus infantis SK1302]|uniref:Transketolase n=1 Tax=Streptococcus infantis SK1302 TaxID=871237 RepID=A0ABN0B695_9STRE|nr:transketolase [Streptococcus infantis SK1302]
MSNLSVNAIRFLGIDAINKANSGHPGVVMGAAPMAYSLFTKELRINPAQPNWINRDRFYSFSRSWFNAPLCPSSPFWF